MTISRSEPYKETTRKNPEDFPEIEFVESNEGKPFSDSPMECNDKPHVVYCEDCEYKTTVQGLAGPRCGHCNVT